MTSPSQPDRRRSTDGRRRIPRLDSDDRRKLDLGAPPAPAWAHVFDIVFFRMLGLALIANEVLGRGGADWHVLVAGFGAFFMPDWLRGRSSPLVRAMLKAWIQQHGGGE